MSARERGMGRWTERGRKPRAQHRSANALELLLVRHVSDVADRQTAVDQLDSPWAAAFARPDEVDEIIGQPVGLHVNFREIAFAVVLHELLELYNLGENATPCAVPFSPPARRSLERRIRLPAEIIGFQPVVSEQMGAII